MGFCDDAEPNFDRAFKDYLLCAISNRGNASKERINVDCRGNFSNFCCWATGFACNCRERRPSKLLTLGCFSIKKDGTKTYVPFLKIFCRGERKKNVCNWVSLLFAVL